MSDRKIQNLMKKLILLFLGLFMTMICLVGAFTLFVLLLYANFQQGKAVVTIISLLLIAGFGMAAFKCFKFVFHKYDTKQDSGTTDIPMAETSTQPPASDIMLENTPVQSVCEQKTMREYLERDTNGNTKQPVNNSASDPEKIDKYVEFENSIQRVDGNPISDDEIPYLIKTGYEKALEKENTNPKRTSREDDLCANFMKNHFYDIEYHVDKFEKLREKAYREKNIDSKIDLLKQTIFEYEKSKKWFYRTKGGMIYFEDMYEHLHNSKNNDFSYIDSVQEELNYYIDKKEIVIPQILSAIGNNGIIQKNIYDLVDSNKSDIQYIIRELESIGKIKREKKGNSYLLTLL